MGPLPQPERPSWTLSAECLAYLLFPAFAATLLTGTRRTLLIAVATTAAIIITLDLVQIPGWTTDYDFHDSYDPRTLIRTFAGFALGMLTWRFEQLQIAPRLTSHWSAAPITALIFIYLMATPGHQWAIVLAMAPLLATLAQASGRTLRLLNTPILYQAGALSFAVYLIHDQLHPSAASSNAPSPPPSPQTPSMSSP